MALDCENAFQQEMQKLTEINENLIKLNAFLGIDKDQNLMSALTENNQYLRVLCVGIFGEDSVKDIGKKGE